jgi:site-specific recombinase XerD
MASLYRRGKVWWSKSYEAGKMVRTSLGTRDKTEARRALKERMRQALTSPAKHEGASIVTWDDASQSLIEYYEAYRKRNPAEARKRLRQLTKYWRGWKLVDIDAAAILTYVSHRRREGKAAATINLDLATLRRALRLAHERGKLGAVPRIKTLKPAPPRQGFLSREEVEVICQYLPDDLALVVRISATFGWRLASEVLTLTQRQVDLEQGTLRLEPGMSKTGDGRLVYLTDELKVGLAEQLTRVTALEGETSTVIPWLFVHLHWPFRGQRIKSLKKPWTRACAQAGLVGTLRHDLRRSAVRQMINAGISERVCMRITGHRSRSIFDRYHIVSPGDLREATRKLSYKSSTMGTSVGHNEPITGD